MPATTFGYLFCARRCTVFARMHALVESGVEFLDDASRETSDLFSRFSREYREYMGAYLAAGQADRAREFRRYFGIQPVGAPHFLSLEEIESLYRDARVACGRSVRADRVATLALKREGNRLRMRAKRSAETAQKREMMFAAASAPAGGE